MKTNVTYLYKDFFVNQSKSTVVCKLTFNIDLTLIPVCSSMLMHYGLCNLFQEKITNILEKHAYDYNYNNGNITITVYGKAKACGSDTFDETFGKNLALTRAQRKAFNLAINIYDKIYEIVSNDIECLSSGAYKAFVHACNHEDNLISKCNG